MKILVCVKVVKGELNPFDESALECALTLSDDVTVISMGPGSAEAVLKPLTRLGAKVILISDNVFAGSDTLATSYILSAAIGDMEYDMILCGRQSIDGDTAQTGPMLSAILGIGLITNALSITTEPGCVSAVTRSGNESATLPALITVERGYVLRFPSIFSKVGEVSVIDNSVLKCDISRCGYSGSPTKVLETFENVRGRRKCQFISRDELLPLIERLKSEAGRERQIPKEQDAVQGCKLKSVWAIGDEVVSKAYEIADEVVVIDKVDPSEIAAMALENKPDVILWNADLWGRRSAPVVAAILGTGLCADCTSLQSDGEALYMYRPAQGGNITAKIKCVTKPVMATVRTGSVSSDIIVSGGKGVAESLDKLQEFAESIGGELGASRGLVDMNKAPYENQVGLTGKTVSPEIYIAVGISGAVHHTCGIEGARYVIAVNPDKDARIFDYADYGIVGEF